MERRKEIIYEHTDDERIRYVKYKDRIVLVTSNFVADMGFAGHSNTAHGFLIGDAKQLDKKSRKYISKLEDLSREERSEIYAQLRSEH